METKWYSQSVREVLEILGSGEHGLSNEEVERRINEQGLNQLPESKADNVLLIFLRQFQSPLIYILIAASAAVFAMGDSVDGIIILFVLVFNAVVGAVQEGRAQNTLLALKRFVETKAVVIRSEKEFIIRDTQVVPGDIILLQEGEKVPADSRIIDSHNLKIDESALTGESEAVHKTVDVLSGSNLTPPEQKNMAFKGTNIVSGNGRAVVVGTGIDTVIGKIASEIATIDTEIPLKANIRHLSRLIIIATAVMSAVIFALGIMYGNPPREMFATVVSVAVSVIPSGLPIAMTLILAAGVWRMSKRNALVKRLQAVEALGQARIIAVDKTGTITKNEMTVQKIYVNNKIFDVSGIGYEPHGEITLNKQIMNPPNHPELLLTGRMAALSTSARVMFQEDTKEWRVSGDPTEGALFVLAEKLGFNKDDLERESPFVSEIPFDYKLKYHSTVHKDGGKHIMTLIGAPEVVLNLCDKVWHDGINRHMGKKERDTIELAFQDMSRKGLRVIALAKHDNASKEYNPEDISNLTFVGFVGMKDALRLEVKEATKRARAAGIKVVMITGDHRITAEAIAKEALIFRTGDSVLTGEEMDKMSDKTLMESLDKISVFARVTPEHKFRIVNAYKARGEIIAMTGDGVNDAPPLVAADLGVAMGKIGTEVAKEAADIILLDDNFGSIVSAIEEGRSIYKTIKKVVLYLVSTSIGEVLVITVAILLGLPLPLIAVQIIWLNFVTDGFFIPALAMEPREKNLMRGDFAKPSKYLIDKLMLRRMTLMVLPMTIATLILFNAYYETDIAKAWTLSLTLLAVFQWFNAWNCRSEDESIFQMNPFSNKFLIGGTLAAFVCQLLAVYHPFFQKFLRTVPLDTSDWIVIMSFATSIILTEEVRKYFARRNNKLPTERDTLQTESVTASSGELAVVS